MRLQTNIEVEITPCIVESISFEESVVSITYAVFSGPMITQFPAIVQNPDCGLELSGVEIVDISSDIAEDKVRAAFTLDKEKAELTIDSQDLSLIGK